MCEHLHYESVYFKELHKEQEYYVQSGGSCTLLSLGIVFHGVLLLLSSCAACHFGLVFHIFYTLWSVFFSVCVLLRISCSLSRFLFTFVVAYVFFSATSSSNRKFSSLFLCLFVNVIEVKTLVFSSLFPRALLFSRFLFSWHFLKSDVKVLNFHCQYARHVLLSSIFPVRI